ncbi:MAG: hypothetical protein JXR49_05090 [Acidobacteria bacterium]|nr:hypothetical protein [Acidobacteriota bacterium]
MKCKEFETNDFFEKYLRGELSDSDAAALEAHCFECDGCFRKLQDTESIIDLIRRTPKEQLLPARPIGIFRVPRFVSGLAGAMAVVIAAALLVPLRWSNPDRYGSIVELSAPVYIPGTVRGNTGNEFEKLFSAGMKFYQGGAYLQAAEKLKEALHILPENPQATYYLGISWLFAGRPETALTYFEKMISRNAVEYLEDCRWYAAMSFLLLGNAKKAESYLQVLKDTDSRYSLSAAEWIDRIHEME